MELCPFTQGNGHLRRLDDCERAQKVSWNYAPSREQLTFEVGKGGVVTEVNKFKTINHRRQDNLDSRGIVNPNKKYIDQGLDPKYRTVVNFILGGNREVMRNLAFGNQKVDWIQENLDSRGIVNPNKKYIGQGLDPKYRTVANFILGGNREVMRNLAFGKQKVDWEHGADNSDLKRMPEIEAWAKDAYAFIWKKRTHTYIVRFCLLRRKIGFLL